MKKINRLKEYSELSEQISKLEWLDNPKYAAQVEQLKNYVKSIYNSTIDASYGNVWFLEKLDSAKTIIKEVEYFNENPDEFIEIKKPDDLFP